MLVWFAAEYGSMILDTLQEEDWLDETGDILRMTAEEVYT